MMFFISSSIFDAPRPVIYNSELLATASDGNGVFSDVYFTRDQFETLCDSYFDEYDHIELTNTVAVTDDESVDYILRKYAQTCN